MEIEKFIGWMIIIFLALIIWAGVDSYIDAEREHELAIVKIESQCEVKGVKDE